MSASSCSSLPVRTDFLLPLISRPFCWRRTSPRQATSRGIVSTNAMDPTGTAVPSSRRTSERLNPQQVARAYQQSGVHQAMQVLAAPILHHAQQGNHAGQLAPLKQQQIQTPPPTQFELLNKLRRPVAAVAAAFGSQALGLVAILLAANNIMLTVLVLLFLVPVYFASSN
ncbi:hypothetical protein VPH35_137380 [Triticum aestivum]|uniref:uncharacterized protein n=1 Tax=Triticum aestivum TaxID=4565 RepID=UPI001D003F6E|nr:uncharacterized protein LOC123169699 [Triticum aestivum]